MSQPQVKSERTLSPPRYSVNRRLLVITLVVLVVASPVAYLWYKYRLAQNASEFLNRAELLEKEEKWDEAANYYQRYLTIEQQGDDSDEQKQREVSTALVKLAQAFSKGKPSRNRAERLNGFLYQAVGRALDSEKGELQSLLAENLLATYEFAAAERIATELVEEFPEYSVTGRKVIALSLLKQARDDGVRLSQEEADRLLSLRAQGEDDGPVSMTLATYALVGAAKDLPSDVELVSSAADTLRDYPEIWQGEESDAASLADQLMDELVAADPENMEARLARYSYRSRYRLPDTGRDLEIALEASPENSQALLLSVAAIDSTLPPQEQLDRAEPLLRKAIATTPGASAPYQALARFQMQAGKLDDALQLLESVRTSVDSEVEIGLMIADIQITLEKFSDAERTIQDLESQITEFTLNLHAASRAQLDNWLQILRARLELAQGNEREGINKLEAVILATETSGGAKRTEEWKQACRLLAQYYSRTAQWDRAGEYWSRLAQAYPGNSEFVTYGVVADLKSANPRAAIRKIDESSRREPLNEDLLISRVQAHLALQMSRQESDRNWSELERALEEAKDQVEGRSELIFEEVRYLATRERGAQAASALLRNAEEAFAQEELFWRNAALWYQQLGAERDLQRALSKHRSLTKSAVQQAALEATVLGNDGNFDAAQALLTKLELSADSEEGKQVARLRLQLLEAGKKTDEALALVKQLIGQSPQETDLLRQAIGIALRANDVNQAKVWEKELFTRDGARFENRMLRAQRQLLSYQQLSVEERRSLGQLITELRGERPRWFPVIALAASHAQLVGDSRNALANYELAVDLGDRRPSTIQQLVTLLFEDRQLQKAQDYLSLLVDDSRMSPVIDSMNIELAIQQDRKQEAIDLAKEGVERFPEDVERRLTLANVLLKFNRRAEAMAVLQEASQQFENDPQILLGLFNAFVQAGRAEEARQTLAVLAANPGGPQEQRSFVVAQGFEMLGDAKAARRFYEQAVAQEPGRTAVRARYARFLRSHDPQNARVQYERVLQQDSSNLEATRELAVLLAATGQEADWQKANELLDSVDEQSSENAITNDRLRAMLLSRKGRTRQERLANCRSARTMLQQLMESDAEGSNDVNQLLLAQILAQEASLSEDSSLLRSAQNQLREVLNRDPENPDRLAFYLDFLLRHAGQLAETAAEGTGSSRSDANELKSDLLKEADERLVHLEQLVKDTGLAGEARLVALKARALQLRDPEANAQVVIDEFVARRSAPGEEEANLVQQYIQFGQLYALIGANEQAEQWYRKAVELAPNAYRLVVESLLAQDKHREATQYCLEVYAANPTPEVAIVLANVMTVTKEPSESLPEAQEVISTALHSHGENLRLLQSEAIRRASLGENDEAIALFRKILQLDPQNLLALNNLATVLAEKPNQRAEALQHVEKAIEIAGRNPSLLDTQGTIYLKLGDTINAIACLEEATVGAVTDPRYYLHLAASYQLAQRTEDAHRMLREARAFGIEKAILTQDDRQLLTDLESAFPADNGTASVPQ